MLTFVFVWISLGLFAGVLASRVMRGGRGAAYDALMGIVGAGVGGLLLGSRVGYRAATLPEQVVVAFVGAIVFLSLLRLMDRPHRLFR